MNSEPCVRLGIRISPKISENPAESRNNRPPSVMLLTASTSMGFMAGAFSTRFRLSPRHRRALPGDLDSSGTAAPRYARWPGHGHPARLRAGTPTTPAMTNSGLWFTNQSNLRFSALERRIVARVDRLRQEPFRIVGPELAHLRIDLHDGVFHLAVLLDHSADGHVGDDIAVVVEADRAARRIGELNRSHRLDEHLRIIGLAAGLLQRRLQNLAVHVVGRRVEADRHVLPVVFTDRGQETLVGRRV